MERVVKKNNCKYQIFIELFPYALCEKQGYIPVWCPNNCSIEYNTDTSAGHPIKDDDIVRYSFEKRRVKDKFNNEVTFILPCWVTDIHSENSYDMELLNNYPLAETENMSPESIEFIRSLVYGESSYFTLLEAGWKPQQARTVLPNALKTELVMTGFINDWKHFFDLRCATNAHPQAQELAIPLREEFVKKGYITDNK